MSETSTRDGSYAWYVVFLCMIAYIFSFVDRQILALLIEPIREDLQISDTQFSLLNGLAFSLFYATMGIPIARLADSRSRPAIIAAGIFLWSLATAATGLGKSFWHIFVARMGVARGLLNDHRLVSKGKTRSCPSRLFHRIVYRGRTGVFNWRCSVISAGRHGKHGNPASRGIKALAIDVYHCWSTWNSVSNNFLYND